MGGQSVSGLVAGVCLTGALTLLTGCGSAAGPTDAQIDSATLPATVAPPNDDSDTGGCALITPEQVAGASGAAISRTSNIGPGCAWSTSGAGGAELVASLRQLGNQDGNGARVFAETLATQEALGPVEEVAGLGDQAFAAQASAPTVWWVQDQMVYSVAIEVVPAGGLGVGVAVELAKIASGNLPAG